MHFNQLVSSTTCSDTPLKSFLNTFCALTPEPSQGKEKKKTLLLTFSGNDYYTQGILLLSTKKLDKLICN